MQAAFRFWTQNAVYRFHCTSACTSAHSWAGAAAAAAAAPAGGAAAAAAAAAAGGAAAARDLGVSKLNRFARGAGTAGVDAPLRLKHILL